MEFDRLKTEFGWNITEHARLADRVWMTGRNDAISYPEDGNAACAAVESDSFWFRHRNRVIEDLLRSTVWPSALWEIGAGNGFVANHFRECGLDVVAIEPGPAGAKKAAERGIAQSVCGFVEDLKIPDSSVPAAGCFDVLEHLEKPEIIIREMHRILRPGGVAAVSVPALKSLWSQADETAGHFRRYSRQMLDQSMTNAGFVRLKSKYMMASMVCPMFLLRSLPYKLGRRQKEAEHVAALQNQLRPKQSAGSWLAEKMLQTEHAVSRVIPMPCGTSVLGVYQKK